MKKSSCWDSVILELKYGIPPLSNVQLAQGQFISYVLFTVVSLHIHCVAPPGLNQFIPLK